MRFFEMEGNDLEQFSYSNDMQLKDVFPKNKKMSLL